MTADTCLNDQQTRRSECSRPPFGTVRPSDPGTVPGRSELSPVVTALRVFSRNPARPAWVEEHECPLVDATEDRSNCQQC